MGSFDDKELNLNDMHKVAGGKGQEEYKVQELKNGDFGVVPTFPAAEAAAEYADSRNQMKLLCHEAGCKHGNPGEPPRHPKHH